VFQSEIRDSEKEELFEKVSKNNYGKYLKKIKMILLRGFSNKEIAFDFPVTAIIGPNGGGKTTVLGAAGLIYKRIKPKRFFAKNGAFDNSMENWKVEYSLIDKEINNNSVISKIANYGSYKWGRPSIDRSVEVFGISRTVPPSEKVEFSKFASSSFRITSDKISKLHVDVSDAVGKILGKNVSEYTQIKVDPKGGVTFLTGKTDSGIEYSEFHFGAGESSIIRMIISIEVLPENSLILIEEIENGLHPLATQRMVEYLIDVALRKKMQTIFTTHSNEALLPLPHKAIWVAANGELYQGKMDIKSLRAITGQIEAKLVIFTEDFFAKEWIENVIRFCNIDNYNLIQVHGLEGDGAAVKINKNHNSDPSIIIPSISFIDGDSQQDESSEDKVFRLPGQSPEAYIFNKILDIIDNVIGELAVSLHQRFENQESIKGILKKVKQTNRDEHLIFSQIGRELGFTSENVVKNAFLSIWSKNYSAEANAIFTNINDNVEM